MQWKIAAMAALGGVAAFAAPASAGGGWVQLHAPGDVTAVVDCVGYQDYEEGVAVLTCADRWDRSRIIQKSANLTEPGAFVRSARTYYYAATPLTYATCTNDNDLRVIFKVDGSLHEGERWDHVGSYRC